jgi:hypothetical protein
MYNSFLICGLYDYLQKMVRVDLVPLWSLVPSQWWVAPWPTVTLLSKLVQMQEGVL